MVLLFGCGPVSRIVVRRVGVVALSGVVPLPATPLRGLRRPLLGQGEVRIGQRNKNYLRIVRSWRWVSIQRSSPPPRSKRAGRSIAIHPPVFNFRCTTSLAPVSRIDATALS